MRQTKFIPGRRIRDLDDLNTVTFDGRWIYYKAVPKHPDWIRNMSVAALSGEVYGGTGMYIAEPNPKAVIARKRSRKRSAAKTTRGKRSR